MIFQSFKYFQVEVEQFNLFCLCSISNSLSLPLWYRHWGDIENKIIKDMISSVITTWYIIYVVSCQYVLAGVWWWQWNRKLVMIILFCRWTATTTRQCSPTASPASCCPSSWTGSHSASSFPFIQRHQTGWTTSFLKETKHFKLIC